MYHANCYTSDYTNIKISWLIDAVKGKLPI